LIGRYDGERASGVGAGTLSIPTHACPSSSFFSCSSSSRWPWVCRVRSDFFAGDLAPRWSIAHLVALVCAGVGLVSPWPQLCVVWLLYCAGSFGLFLVARARSLASPSVLAAFVPFLFSNVAAVWLVAGSNELRLLGYGMIFSYYASLQGDVLGWIFVGAIAILADRKDLGRERNVYVGAALVCFVSFLLVALGIDQLRTLKPIGVAGLSIALPLAQLLFLRGVRTRHRVAFVLGCLSFAGLVFTMVLAWGNELAMPVLGQVAGTRAMVSVHGVSNALIVAPCFLLAVVLDTKVARGDASGQHASPSDQPEPGSAR
jgi:hypothetical protein